MAARDPRIDAYIERAEPFARPILVELRERVHRACPEVTEAVKWGMPSFEHHGLLAHMASFRRHCAFGFWKGALVVGEPETERTGMGHLGRIESLEQLPPEAEMAVLLRRAMELNEQGVSAPRARSAPPDGEAAPEALLEALREHPVAWARWEAFVPGKRREYAAWIAEAKTEPTRQRRVATALEWIADGKGRNWKYERKA